MNRTPRKRAFDTGLVYDDPDYQDAYDLTQSDTFFASSNKTERLLITCQSPIEGLLDEYADAASAYYPANKHYAEMENACRDKDGTFPSFWDKHGRFAGNPILALLEQRVKPLEDAYWKSLSRLGDALEVEIVVCIKEALSLAGVTDAALMDEICRCVIRGGQVNDGGNLRQRGLLYADPSLCPHCGQPNEPGEARCFSCEKLIG